MALCFTFNILLLVVFLSVAVADTDRTRRSPQFSQASASAGSFDNYPRGFGRHNLEPPRPPVFGRGPQFGGRSPVFGPPGFGNSGFGRPGSGATINIAKSISISTGGRGGGARSSSGGFGNSLYGRPGATGGFGK